MVNDDRTNSQPPGQQHEAPAGLLTVQLDTELMSWVNGQGGADWVRSVLGQLRQQGHATVRDKASVFADVEKLVVGAIKETRDSHGGEILPASVAKRAASQVWAAWYSPRRLPVGPIPDEPGALVDWLETRHVHLYHYRGQQLQFHDPGDAVSPAVRKQIGKHKAKLLAIVMADPERFPSPEPKRKPGDPPQVD